MTLVSTQTGHNDWVLDDVEAAYRRYRATLLRLATLALGDAAAAEEVVQDVFADVYRRPPTLEHQSKLEPYLRRAVLNRCRSGIGRAVTGRRATLRLAGRREPERFGPEDGASASDARSRVLAAVRALPGRQRDVVLLRFYAELSEAEIAATLGVSPGTVKSAAHRAMAHLAPLLEDLR